MTEFRWRESLRIGDETIDAQHRHFFDAGQRIAQAIEAGYAVPLLAALLREVADSIVHHFACEEEYLHRINFPEAAAHRMEHLALLAVIDEAMERIDDKRQPDEIAVITRQMLLVLTEHILLEDLKIKAFLKKGVP